MSRHRNEHLNVRLRADELEKLRALAEDGDEGVSALIRRFIRRTYVTRLGAAGPRSRKPRSRQ